MKLCFTRRQWASMLTHLWTPSTRIHSYLCVFTVSTASVSRVLISRIWVYLGEIWRMWSLLTILQMHITSTTKMLSRFFLGMTIPMTVAFLKWFHCLRHWVRSKMSGLSSPSSSEKTSTWLIFPRRLGCLMTHIDRCTLPMKKLSRIRAILLLSRLNWRDLRKCSYLQNSLHRSRLRRKTINRAAIPSSRMLTSASQALLT